MKEKIYHIYAKNQCIYHSLSEEEFTKTWEMLHMMIELLGSEKFSKEDISFEELVVGKKEKQEGSY